MDRRALLVIVLSGISCSKVSVRAQEKSDHARRAMLSWLMGFREPLTSDDPSIRWMTAREFGELATTYAHAGRFEKTLELAARTVESPRGLEAEVSVTDQDNLHLRPGMPVHLGGKPSHIVEVGAQSLDGVTRFRCELEAANSYAFDGELTVRVAFGPVNGVAVPRRAIIHAEDHDEVVLLRRELPSGDAELERRQVVLDRSLGDDKQAVAIHGLGDGDLVVLSNPRWLAEQL